eukprot:SAG22_NODE_2800_length_2200_cov_1.099000_4_plen_143_part_01
MSPLTVFARLRLRCLAAGYSKPGCGYCVSNGWDGDCVPGDMTGAFSPAAHDCHRQYTAGVHRTAESMCVVTVGKDDVRCYKDCTYGMPGQGETFVVPDKAACNEYDTAYTRVKTEVELRRQVEVHVAGCKHSPFSVPSTQCVG